MKLVKSTPITKSGIEIGKSDPSQSLLKLVNKELKSINDIYENLSNTYHETTDQQFEKRFIETRNTFKGSLRDISNTHHSYINRSEKRKETVENIPKSSTAVAQRFQEARENKRLDHSKCTDSLEDLRDDLKNLKYLIEQQGKP